jgi:hypothetical protein
VGDSEFGSLIHHHHDAINTITNKTIITSGLPPSPTFT